MDDAQVKVYPILPASTTGDLWHLASAAILNKRWDSLRNPRGLHVIPVIFIDGRASTRERIETLGENPKNKEELRKQYVNGSITFNFLKDLGVDCIALAVKGAPAQDGNAKIQAMLWSMEDDWFDKVFDAQQHLPGYQKLSFMETLDNDKSLAWVDFPQKGPNIFAPREKKRSLHYHSGTTAALMTLANPKTRRERLEYLATNLNAMADGLTKRVDSDLFNQNIEKQAHERFTTFLDIAGTLRRKSGNLNQKVIIYNNRGNDVNAQTNSSVEIFTNFRDIVQKDPFNMAIIVINTGGPQLPDVAEFDLFNRRSRDMNDAFGKFSPGIDPLVTCRFFRMIALASKEHNIFGLFSGRSGSCDVAAFNGVNCFYWDTPYIELAAYNPDIIASYGFNVEQVRNYNLQDFRATYHYDFLLKGIKDNQPKGVKPPEINKDALMQRAKQEILEKYPLPTEAIRKQWDTLYSEAGNQLAQSYRTLQQFLIMAVGYPASKQNAEVGKGPWASMRDYPFIDWLKGASFLETPLFPRCPRILPDVLNIQLPVKESEASLGAWVYWNVVGNNRRQASVLPDQRGALYEAEGVDWGIVADVLRADAGFSFQNPKTDEQIKAKLFPA